MIARSTSQADFAARQRAVEKWRLRSRVVAVWRLILPLSIVAILLAIGGWIVTRTLVDDPVPAETPAADRMTGPRFYGVDGRDRTWVLAAESAFRDAREKRRVTLEHPNFNLGAGRVKANEGFWVEDSASIILRGDVLLIDGDGGRMATQEAMIDTRTGTVTNRSAPGGGRVQIENDMGRISADDYVIAKNGDVTFRGRVSGVINGR